ncbi:MAG: phosphocholine cytidylyltransferase family protein [Comamonadaceae bacterium]|nr:MAG: phosphocholine cytidylyltransferase family protein [Comamonadaceae bacterium]
MKAIILAAGRGSRMQKLTDDRPKCLVELRGQCLLDRQLAALRAAGISEIGIVTGYRRELIAQHVQGQGVAEFHNPRWSETNMVSSLEAADAWLAAEPCIVSYSDIFYQPGGVQALMRSTAALALTYDPHWLRLWQQRFADPLSDAETFRLRPDGTLSEIGNKPTSVDQVQGQYMGLLRFTPQGWAEVGRIRAALPPLVRDKAHMTGTLQAVIAEGRVPVHAVPYEQEWGEIDSADDLAVYEG